MRLLEFFCFSDTFFSPFVQSGYLHNWHLSSPLKFVLDDSFPLPQKNHNFTGKPVKVTGLDIISISMLEQVSCTLSIPAGGFRFYLGSSATRSTIFPRI